MTERSMADAKPIIFAPESVRAILAGRKTETRRVIKPQPEARPELRDAWAFVRPLTPRGYMAVAISHFEDEKNSAMIKGPYGQSRGGCRLWVKERHLLNRGTAEESDSVTYADPIHTRSGLTGWRSPLFMPRWATRCIIETIAVQVERLHCMDDAAAKREGAPDLATFRIGWDALNAKRGFEWESNPWVWVVSFRVVWHASGYDRWSMDFVEAGRDCES